MTNLVKSHSFVVKKANGIDDFRIQLRAGYWASIDSEKKLREVLEKSFTKPGVWFQANKKHYENGNVLVVLRNYGMIAGSERLVKKS